MHSARTLSEMNVVRLNSTLACAKVMFFNASSLSAKMGSSESMSAINSNRAFVVVPCGFFYDVASSKSGLCSRLPSLLLVQTWCCSGGVPDGPPAKEECRWAVTCCATIPLET